MIVLAAGSTKERLPEIMRAAETILSIAGTGHMHPGGQATMMRGHDKVEFGRDSETIVLTRSPHNGDIRRFSFSGLPRRIEGRAQDDALAMAEDLIARIDSLHANRASDGPDLPRLAAIRTLLALAGHQKADGGSPISDAEIHLPYRGESMRTSIAVGGREWTMTDPLRLRLGAGLQEHEWCMASRSNNDVSVIFDLIAHAFHPVLDMPAAMRHIEIVGLDEDDLVLEPVR